MPHKGKKPYKAKSGRTVRPKKMSSHRKPRTVRRRK